MKSDYRFLMMDDRKHSVDILISKTLVALSRVRSLRDPSTNSMIKHSSSIDNLHWDNLSRNGFLCCFWMMFMFVILMIALLLEQGI